MGGMALEGSPDMAHLKDSWCESIYAEKAELNEHLNGTGMSFMPITKASLSFRLSPALLICTKGVWGRGNTQKWSRPSGRRVFGRAACGPRNRHDGVCSDAVSGCCFGCRGGRLGRQMAVFGHVEAVLGHAKAARASRFVKKCTLQYAPCF